MRPFAHLTLAMLCAALAGLSLVLPVVSVCLDSDCCPESAVDGACYDCNVIDCFDETSEVALVWPGWDLTPSFNSFAELTPHNPTALPSPRPGPAPTISPGLTTTVLRI